MRGRAERLALALLAALLTLPACSDSVESAPAVRPAVVVPDVPREGLEPAIRAALVQAHAAATATSATADDVGRYGMQLHSAGLVGPAGEVYAVAASMTTDDPHWHYLFARLEHDAGRLDEAVAAYGAAARRAKPARDGAAAVAALHHRFAMALLDAERLDEAGEHASTARRLAGDHPAVLLLLARLADEPERAADLLDLALTTARPSRELLSAASVAHARAGRDRSAADLAQRAAAAPSGLPGLPDPWMAALVGTTLSRNTLRRRAAAALERDDLRAAFAALTRCVEADPADAESRGDLALVLARGGDLNGALAAAEQAVADAPEEAAPHAALGRVLVLRGESARAREHLVTAAERAPDDREAALALAALDAADGRYAAALERARGLHGAAPGDVVAARLVARVLVVDGRAGEAVSVLRVAREGRGAQHEGLDADLVRVLAVAGDGASAVSLGERLLRRERSVRTLESRAHARAAAGDDERALDALRQALVLARASGSDAEVARLALTLDAWNREGPAAAPWSGGGASFDLRVLLR